MSDVIYVNFKTGEASYVGYSSEKILVGPIMSIVDGVHHLTVGKSLDEIKNLRRPKYQQPQLPHPRLFEA